MPKRGMIEEIEFHNKEIGLFEVLKIERTSEPSDGVKKVEFCFIGLKNRTPINKCTYEEFEDIYGYYIKGILGEEV
jgi:hypothetical protein